MAGNLTGPDFPDRGPDQVRWTDAADLAVRSRKLHAEYAGYLLIRPGAERLSSIMYGPEMQDLDLLATAWMAHTVRADVERYDRAYLVDAHDHRDLRRYVAGRLGSTYFMQSCQDVFFGNCTTTQLGLVLNEQHPRLEIKHGFYQPPKRDCWPGIRSSNFIHKPSDEVLEARAAIAGFVSRLPYIKHVPRNPSAQDRAMIRAVAEAEFFWRTSIQNAPVAINAARNARIATALFRHMIENDTSEFVPMLNGQRSRIPRRVSELIEWAQYHVPAARQLWRSRY
ncbi:MAG TPA: hypothetical protein VLG47_07425 [Candidatus Saccharimonadales bacterium]|nr:hypothetical protein [Candidatus Saccharimonadales bacterium]